MAELKSLIVNGVTRLNNTSYATDLYANKFIKNSSSDSYVLLGAGGHKLISDFALASHTHGEYVLKAGDTMTGNLTFSGAVGINFPTTSAKITRTGGTAIHTGADVASSTDANLRFGSWYGIGWYPTISGQTIPQGENAMWLNVRTGYLYTRGGFVKNGSSDNYVLLGAGGHKLITDFATATHNHDTRYVIKTGDTMTGPLTMAGKDIMLGTTSSSSNDSADLTWTYGNGSEKMRIWSQDTPTTAIGPNYRIYNSSGTSLYSGTLVTAAGHGATGTWSISITGNADTLDGYHASSFSLTTHSHNYINSLGALNPQTGRTQAYGNVYSYNTNASANTGMPTTYTAVMGFGRGTGGTVEIAGNYVGSGSGMWYRALRDWEDNWYGWTRIIDANNISSYLSGYSPTNHTHSNYVTLDTLQTITGVKNFTNTIRIVGTTPTPTWDTPARIEFAENASSSQAVSLVYTSYDSYRATAGIKLLGNQGGEWFESPMFVKTGSNASQLLRGDGGTANFNWSGQGGQPSWLWGGNSQHTYYVYNPSNFSVNYANSAGNADTVDNWHLGNIVWSGYVTSGTANLSSYWGKAWEVTLTTYQYNDCDLTFLISGAYSGWRAIVNVRLRQNGANSSGAYNFTAQLYQVTGNIPLDYIRLYYNNTTGNCQLWMNCVGQYNVYNYTVIKKTWRTGNDTTAIGTLYSTSFSTAQALPGSGYTYISMSPISLQGYYWANVALQTSSSTGTSPTFAAATISGNATAGSFIKSGSNASQLLRGDGGVATFNWSGQSGQPTWVWGGGTQHAYYVYNPSNFDVNSAYYLRINPPNLSSTNYGTLGGILQDSTYGPESGQWTNRLKILHNNSSGYYTELAMSFTGTNGVYFRANRGGTVGAWKRLAFTDEISNFVYVSQHTGNDVNYPLVWSNQQNENTVAGNQLFKSWNHLYYNPANRTLTAGTLNLRPVLNSYREGIRIYPTGGWSTIVLGGSDLTALSGTSTNTWTIHNNDSNFYISKNASNAQTVNRLWGRAGGGWTIGNTSNASYTLEVGGDVRLSAGWFRTTGAAGWYSETYGGGWYMTDSTYVRTHNNKKVYALGYCHSTVNSDSYVLLAGGGYTALSNLASSHNHDSRYGMIAKGTTSSSGTKYILLGTIPVSSSGTYDSFNIVGDIGSWGASGKQHIDVTIGGRDGIYFKGFVSDINAGSYDIGVDSSTRKVYIIMYTQYTEYDLHIFSNQSTLEWTGTSVTLTNPNFTLLSASTTINKFSSGSFLGNASSATNSDKLDGYHATDFSLSGHTHSYYWANVAVSTASNATTSPTFGYVGINGTNTSYRLYVNGQSSLVQHVLYGIGTEITGDNVSDAAWMLLNNGSDNWIRKGNNASIRKYVRVPWGFSSWSSGVTWGNTTGTSFACWNDSTGGSIDFRRDNPSSGKMSIKVDGRVYVNEGTNPVLSASSVNGYWSMRTPDGSDAWISTSTSGIIPYTSGGEWTGHSSLGTSSWYFGNVYTQCLNGIHFKSVEVNNSANYATSYNQEIYGIQESTIAKFSIIRTSTNAPSHLIGNYSSGISWKNKYDTFGGVMVAYNSPQIRFHGGNGVSNPVWWMGITGTTGVSYNLANMATTSNCVIDHGGSLDASTTIYSIPSKRVFSGLNMPDAPKTGWISGLVLGSNWNNNHYQHYLVEIDSRWYATRSYGSSKMTNWQTFAYLSDLNSAFTSLALSNSTLSVTISGTTRSVKTMLAVPTGGYGSMNDVATLGNAVGMTNLTVTDTTVNPNGQTNWHHFINLSYNTESTNMWQTQFAIKAGTTDVWVRSRNGGTVTAGTAWTAPWVRLAKASELYTYVYMTVSSASGWSAGNRSFVICGTLPSSRNANTVYFVV